LKSSADTDMSASKLFEPYTLGPITLANRAVMAPLTRNRAAAGFVPGPLRHRYYASGAFLAPHHRCEPGLAAGPGLSVQPASNPKQVAGWRKVTDQVHARGGRIFIQLCMSGRIYMSASSPAGQAGVASAIRPIPRPSSAARSPRSPSRARWS